MALKYKIALPAPGAGDVVGRELEVIVNGEPSSTIDLPASASEHVLLLERGANVTVTLTDIDGNDNRSIPSVPLSFVAVDLTAPPQPGPLSATNEGQDD